MELKVIKVWYSIADGGDGSVSIRWFLTKEDVEKDQEDMYENGEGWGEPCFGSVETFVNSDIWKIASKRNR